MNASDIVGWVNSPIVFCTNHEPVATSQNKDDIHPIFAMEEGWEDMTCDSCGRTLGDVEGVE
jgi:hypothetical protein